MFWPFARMPPGIATMPMMMAVRRATLTSRSAASRSADGQHELALRPARLARLVRAARVGEREGRGDVGPQSALGDERGEGLHPEAVGLDEEAGDPDAPRGELAQLLGAPGHGDEHAVVAEGRERVLRRVAADEVEHDVDVADTRPHRPGRVVDGLVRPERGEERVLLRAGRADHVGAARLRDLHREMPDSARGGRGSGHACRRRRRPSRRAPARRSGPRAGAPPPRRRRGRRGSGRAGATAR